MALEKLFLIVILVVTVLSFPWKADAISIYPTSEPDLVYTLPYPGILPDHPLYPLKRIRDGMLLLLSRDSLRTIELNRLFADKHLVMATLLWEKEKFTLAHTTFMRGERFLLSCAVEVEKLNAVGDVPPGLADKIELAARKHAEIITKRIAYTDDEALRSMLNDALAITNQAMDHISLEE